MTDCLTKHCIKKIDTLNSHLNKQILLCDGMICKSKITTNQESIVINKLLSIRLPFPSKKPITVRDVFQETFKAYKKDKVLFVTGLSFTVAILFVLIKLVVVSSELKNHIISSVKEI